MSDNISQSNIQEQALLRAQEVMRILGEWGINSDAQISILGCQGVIKSRDMRKFQDGM
jgi:hypothetical protein